MEYGQDSCVADTAQPSRDADLGTLCMTMDKRFWPLAKYFERGVTMGQWEHIFRESTSTFEPCDRILSWQFREALRSKFPRSRTWVVFVTPVPHDSMIPRTACKITKFNGRARMEFTSYEAALSAVNHLHNHRYTATAPDECK